MVGPFVFWSGGGGSAPPATPSDKFAPKYLVGNVLSGDGNSLSDSGFIYILDPGDGSGIQTALGQPNGPGDVYVRPGSYVASSPVVFTVPAGVRVVGSGTNLTVLTGIGLILDTDSEVSGLTLTVDTGTAVSVSAPGSGVHLEDLLIEVNGVATTGVSFVGPGFIAPPFLASSVLSRVQVEITSPGAVGISATTGALVTFTDVTVNGGAESLRVESDAAVFGTHAFFSNATTAGVRYTNGTGGAPIRLEESAIVTSSVAVLLQDRVDSIRFHNCFLIGDSAGVDVTTADITGMTCTGCSIVGQNGVSGLGGLNASQIIFDACNIQGYNGYGLDIAVNATDISLVGCVVEGGTSHALRSSAKVSAANTTFRAFNALSCSLDTTGASTFSGCTFISGGAAASVIELSSGQNVFASCQVSGPATSASVMLNANGNCLSSLNVNSLANTAPAVRVSSSENTISTLRTQTDPGQFSVVLEASSANNILLGLNARGPGSALLAVSDLGVGNEVAHVIGT